MQRVGQRLTDEMFAGEWTLDFEGYRRQWKAGGRYREAVNAAQSKGLSEGDPDERTRRDRS